MADVDGAHMRRAALQQHLREAAGRGADVERLACPPGRSRNGRGRRSASARRAKHSAAPGRRSRSTHAVETLWPGLRAIAPSTRTARRSIASRARERVANSPRRTSSSSRRMRLSAGGAAFIRLPWRMRPRAGKLGVYEGSARRSQIESPCRCMRKPCALAGARPSRQASLRDRLALRSADRTRSTSDPGAIIETGCTSKEKPPRMPPILPATMSIAACSSLRSYCSVGTGRHRQQAQKGRAHQERLHVFVSPSPERF